MKKLLILIILLTTVVGIKAQRDPGTFSLTPKVGVSLANLSNNDLMLGNISLKSKYKAGFIAGMQGEYQITSLISATLGAYYATLGNRYDDYEQVETKVVSAVNIETHNSYHDYFTTLGYVLVPVMANVYVAKGLSLQAGVQAGFLTNAKTEYDVATITINTQTGVHTSAEMVNYNNTSKAGYKTVDFSIPIGLSYEYANVVVDARYNIGLTNISDVGLKNKNRLFTFAVGYKFDL